MEEKLVIITYTTFAFVWQLSKIQTLLFRRCGLRFDKKCTFLHTVRINFTYIVPRKYIIVQ